MIIMSFDNGRLAAMHVDSGVAVVVQPLGEGNYEPLYAIVRGNVSELPPCFELSDETIIALQHYESIA
jgi:hypothetical protein